MFDFMIEVFVYRLSMWVFVFLGYFFLLVFRFYKVSNFGCYKGVRTFTNFDCFDGVCSFNILLNNRLNVFNLFLDLSKMFRTD